MDQSLQEGSRQRAHYGERHSFFLILGGVELAYTLFYGVSLYSVVFVCRTQPSNLRDVEICQLSTVEMSGERQVSPLA